MEREKVKKKYDISEETLQMIERGLEELKKGNVSDPIDIKEDFSELFESINSSN